jgi:uncharacterized protein YgiM (DUF1202 family)
MAAVIGLLTGANHRRTVRRVAIVFGALALVFAALAGARWWAFQHTERAVVAVKTSQVRTGPGESFEVALPVQEGWTMRLLRRDADWAEVVGEGGVTGWIPTSALAIVRPSPEMADPGGG